MKLWIVLPVAFLISCSTFPVPDAVQSKINIIVPNDCLLDAVVLSDALEGSSKLESVSTWHKTLLVVYLGFGGQKYCHVMVAFEWPEGSGSLWVWDSKGSTPVGKNQDPVAIAQQVLPQVQSASYLEDN